ncbi:MAG: hypothetical protein ACE5EX_03355, partial [Phycisphaerae bacterium]
RFAYRTSTRWRDVSRVSPVAAEVRRRIAELQEAVELCGELLDLFDELDGMTHDVQRFNRRLVRVDELRTRIHQESRAYRLVNLYTQLAELRRFTADRRIHAADNDDAERAKRQIARDRDFITGVRDGAKDLRPILERALERLRAMAVPPCA